jgi:hypothetical protein
MTFLTIAGNVYLHQVGREESISVLRDAFSVKFPDIKII